MKKQKIPKDFVLKEVLQRTGWNCDKDGVFTSLEVDLKGNDIFYKDEVRNGKVIQHSITVKELKWILETHSHILQSITKGWYEEN